MGIDAGSRHHYLFQKNRRYSPLQKKVKNHCPSTPQRKSRRRNNHHYSPRYRTMILTIRCNTFSNRPEDIHMV